MAAVPSLATKKKLELHKAALECNETHLEEDCPCASARSVTVSSRGGSVRGSDENPSLSYS